MRSQLHSGYRICIKPLASIILAIRKHTLRDPQDPLHWYDYPAFYDMGFRDETKPEADFFEKVFEKYSVGKVQSLLEPGCGSGRLVVEMAARGYSVTGFDLNEVSLRYLQQRLNRRKLSADVRVGDMTNFSLGKTYDAAFNTYNTFRHLTDETGAQSHLKHVADHLRSGGLFILGLHLFPPGCDPMGSERWKVKTGKTEVTYTLKVLSTEPRKRLEHLRIIMSIKTASGKRQLRAEFPLRTYNATQFKKTLQSEPRFELCEVFDFWYDINEPQKLDNQIVDTVVVLRKK